MSKRLTFGLMLPLAACQPSAQETENRASTSAETEITTNAAPANTSNAAERAAPPATETPVDETSAAAAAQFVKRYGELLEQRRFAGARRMWADIGQSDAEFAASFDKYATIRATTGSPGDTEGAAGSIYVEVPLTLSGTLKSGGRYSFSGPVTLRRVNDVPGSTAEQRRWHIYATDLKPA